MLVQPKIQAAEALLQAGALQSVIFNSAHFSCIATDAQGVIQLFNVGAERMLGYAAANVLNQLTLVGISDPQEVIAQAKSLSVEFGTPVAPGFEALVFKAMRGVEDIYKLTYIRKDGSRLSAVVSVTALRDAQDAIIGYLLIGTDNTEHQRAEETIRSFNADLERRVQERTAELAWERERLKFIFNSVPVGISFTLTEADGRMTNLINDAHLRICGLTREQADQYGFFQKITEEGFFKKITEPEDYQRQALLARQLDDGEIDHYSLDKRYLQPDGQTIWVMLSFQRRKLANGSHEDLSIVVDITWRKQMEAALLHSREKLAVTLNSIGDAVLATDAQRRITLMNPVAEKLTGWTQAEALGRPVEEVFCIINEQTRQPAVIPVDDVLQTGVIHGLANHTIVIACDGTERPVADSAAPIRDKDGHILGVVLVFRDVSGERAAQRALRENEERFHTLANHISQLAWMADAQGSIFWYNQRWFEYTGTTLEEMRGWGWQKVHHPDHVQRVVDKIKRCFETGEVWEDTFPLRAPDGQYRWFLSRAVPIRDDHGTVLRWFGTNTDITERKQAEEEIQQLYAELNQRAAQLEEANKELATFSYSVSHDLRAPLRAVDGFSRILMNDYATHLDANGVRILGVIHNETQRMGKLIEDLLTFSRLGQHPIEQEPINMHALAQSVFDELAAQEPERKLRLDLHPLPPAIGTNAMIQQMWVNLISNAIKFTKGRATGEIEIGARDGQDGVPIYFVKDNGAGFDMRYANKLFGVFERLHTQQEFPGTGVGLALVQRIVHRHGGRVWAEAAVNRGATFSFSLPCQNH